VVYYYDTLKMARWWKIKSWPHKFANAII